ncbi:hypothetical protein GCM10008014_17370 [Paenibacillus silvae]|uniref:Uncharacterized protein n=1 Tax=Paenibacillus silvae TaxID=1325358 RepID=A0ABQ1Z8N8_9BACL|nr:hypothetical protein GCM10008014_17370 [Paenibacillus silvae]
MRANDLQKAYFGIFECLEKLTIRRKLIFGKSQLFDANLNDPYEIASLGNVSGKKAEISTK